jgi:hypothetical protein
MDSYIGVCVTVLAPRRGVSLFMDRYLGRDCEFPRSYAARPQVRPGTESCVFGNDVESRFLDRTARLEIETLARSEPID